MRPIADDYRQDLEALIDKGQGLPGRYFTDEAFFAVERRRVFEASWTCIGLSADVGFKGDMCAVTLLGYPLLMVRDGETLRVFHNVCSHRGPGLLPDGAPHGPRLACLYPPWPHKLNAPCLPNPHAVTPA